MDLQLIRTLEWDTWCQDAIDNGKDANRTWEPEQICLGNGYKLMKCLNDSGKQNHVLAIEKSGRRYRSTINLRDTCQNYAALSQSLFRAALILGKTDVCGTYSCLASSVFQRPNLKFSRVPSLVEDIGENRIACNKSLDEPKICFEDAVYLPKSTIEQLRSIPTIEVKERPWSKNTTIMHINIGEVSKECLEKLREIVDEIMKHKHDEAIPVGFDWIEVPDRWSRLSDFSVSTAVYIDAETDKYGKCDAWTLESQQLIVKDGENRLDPEVRDMEKWEIRAKFENRKVTSLSVKGEVSESWIKLVKKTSHKKVREENITDEDALIEDFCVVPLPLKLDGLEEVITGLRKDQLLLVARFMDMLTSREDSTQISTKIFDRWQIHHNRGIMLFGGLKPHYRKLRRYLGTTATEKGVLVPVSILLRGIFTFLVLCLAGSTIPIVLILYSPEECDEDRCSFWMKSDVMIFIFGIVITFLTLAELIAEEDRNLRSIFSGRFRVRSIGEASFWTLEKKEDIISLIWVPSQRKSDPKDGTKEYFIETDSNFLHGDIDNAHYLRLIRMSYQNLNVTRPPFWNNLKFEMRFPLMNYKQLDHLFYFTEDLKAVVGLKWAKSVIIKNNKSNNNKRIHVLSVFQREDNEEVKACLYVPDDIQNQYYFS